MGLYALRSRLNSGTHTPGLGAHSGCVHAGAALFGDNPRLVAGRISALAYGTDTCQRHRPGMRGDTFVIDGRLM